MMDFMELVVFLRRGSKANEADERYGSSASVCWFVALWVAYFFLGQMVAP